MLGVASGLETLARKAAVMDSAEPKDGSFIRAPDFVKRQRCMVVVGSAKLGIYKCWGSTF